jgi:hypothetical protein
VAVLLLTVVLFSAIVPKLLIPPPNERESVQPRPHEVLAVALALSVIATVAPRQSPFASHVLPDPAGRTEIPPPSGLTGVRFESFNPSVMVTPTMLTVGSEAAW